MTREELVRLHVDNTSGSRAVMEYDRRVVGRLLDALEGHAVVDGQPVKLMESDACEHLGHYVAGVSR